jgi:hypothetical protein
MTGDDLATAADVANVLAEVRSLRALVTALAERLPPAILPVAQVAKSMQIDARTLRSRFPSAVLKIGSRVMVDTAKLNPPSAEQIGKLARAARGSL